jgi:hypothetical protein
MSSYLRADAYEDYIYYDSQIVDLKQGTEGRPDPVIRIADTRASPLVLSQREYYFSLIRANLTGMTYNLPLTCSIAQKAPNTDVDLTIWSVTLDLSANYDVPSVGNTQFNITKQAYLRHIPEFLNELPPPVPVGGIQNPYNFSTSKYYWLTSFATFCQMWNTASAQALADIQTDFNTQWIATGTATPPPTLTTTAPFIIYDPGSSLFSIYCDTYGYGDADRLSVGTTSDEQFTIFQNTNLQGMLNNFKCYYLGIDTITGKEYQLLPSNILGQNIGASASPSSSGSAPTTRYYILTQDYTSQALWSPTNSIVFLSSQIGTQPENTNPPVNVDFGTGTGSSTSATSNVVTDITLPFTNAGDWRQNINFQPSIYRLISLGNSDKPIQTIDFTLAWKNRFTGEIVPITGYNQASLSLKIMFVKKTALVNPPYGKLF